MRRSHVSWNMFVSHRIFQFYGILILCVQNSLYFTGNLKHFQAKTLLWYKKDIFLYTSICISYLEKSVYSAVRVATFTGIYQGSRLLSPQGQLRLSDVQANWCLIMIPGIIIAGNGQAAHKTVKLTEIICSDIQGVLHCWYSVFKLHEGV